MATPRSVALVLLSLALTAGCDRLLTFGASGIDLGADAAMPTDGPARDESAADAPPPGDGSTETPDKDVAADGQPDTLGGCPAPGWPRASRR